MSNTAQRKRRTAGSPPGDPKPRGRVPAGRAAHANRRAGAGRAPSRRSVTDRPPNSLEEGLEVVVVDLTSEAAEATHVVDLTSNDSVLLVDEGPQGRGESYVVSSDDDDARPPATDASTPRRTRRSSRLTPGTISCPVCMDTYSEMMESGRLAVSTRCGHVFCSQCLRDALRCSQTCPTCRKRLTPRQYHPLYV